MWSSFRFGFRLLRKNPGYSLTAAITLALGVGVSATAYSFVEPLLLRPSAFPEIDRLVSIRRSPTGPNMGGSHKTIPPAQFREWQANTRTFEELAGWTGWMVDVGGPGEAVRVTGCLVTPDFFRTLRVRLAWGAGFTSGAHEPGGPNELILGHGLWQRTFGGDTNIVGRMVELTQNTYTIVGIMPEPAMYPPGAELWAPLAWNTSDWAKHDSNLLHVIGRLHPKESRQRALAELRTLTGNHVAGRPMERVESTLVARPLREEMMLGDLVMLGLAGGVVGFVLLLVCANVANLQLTHGLARRHELAVRAALGAGRRRLFGQMLAESVMLGLLGGGLGLLLAMWAIPLVKLHLSTELGIAAAQLDAVSLSHRALGFTTVLSMFVGIVTGMFPAWSVSRSDLINTLKEGGRQSAGDHRGQRVRRGLVIAQIALAVGLLTGAGVFLHAFQLGLRFEPGMDLDRVLAFQVHPSGPLYAHPGQRQDFQARSLEILAAIPGVEAVAVADGLPVGTPPRRTLVEVEPDAEGTRTAAISASRHSVDAHYFETLGIPLRRGRGFTSSDRVETPQVAVVSETFAKSLPEGINPVGLRLRLLNDGEDPQSVTIVGLVADVQGDPWSWSPRAIYLPLPPSHSGNQAFLLRTMLSPESLKSAVRNGLRESNPHLPVPGLESLRTVVRSGMGAIPMLAPLLGALVVLGLGLSALGVYGVIAQNVAARTSEIGIRLALGSTRFAVFRLVLVHGLRMTLWGVAIGLPLAFLLAWGIGSQVLDPASAPHIAFGIVGATLAAITLAAGLACWLPARQAMRLDPLQALRSE